MVDAKAGWVEAEMDAPSGEAPMVVARAEEATARAEEGMAMVAQAAAESTAV